VHGEMLIGMTQSHVANGKIPIGKGYVARFDVPGVAVDVEGGGA